MVGSLRSAQDDKHVQVLRSAQDDKHVQGLRSAQDDTLRAARLVAHPWLTLATSAMIAPSVVPDDFGT